MEGISESRTLPATSAEKKVINRVTAGSIAEAIGGIGGIVLAIIGLVTLSSYTLAAVAAIVAGIGLFLSAGSVLTRFSALLDVCGRSRTGRLAFDVGVAAGFAGGIIGAVLGVLAASGMAPGVLLGVAAIAFGCALIANSGMTARLNWLPESQGVAADPHPLARDMVLIATGTQLFTGFGAVVLGILALAGAAPLVLCLVAMLTVSFALLRTGTALGNRMVRIGA